MRRVDHAVDFLFVQAHPRGHIEFLLRSVDLFGAEPFIRYGYRHATSTIPVLGYNKHEFTVGVKAITF